MFQLAKIDVNGTCLAEYLPETVTAAKMREVFGKAEDGYWDEEKGYDGEEWQFTDGANVFTVYSRWGAFRVGAYPGTPKLTLISFVNFITEKVK